MRLNHDSTPIEIIDYYDSHMDTTLKDIALDTGRSIAYLKELLYYPENHKTHLSFSSSGWILINQGSPLCDYKKTYEEVMKVVAFYKITLPEVTWNGDRSEWVTTNTIEEIA